MHVCICTYPPERQHPCFPGRLVGETSCLQKSKGLNIGSKSLWSTYPPSAPPPSGHALDLGLSVTERLLGFLPVPGCLVVPGNYFATVPTTGPQRKPRKQLITAVTIVTVSFQGYTQNSYITRGM